MIILAGASSVKTKNISFIVPLGQNLLQCWSYFQSCENLKNNPDVSFFCSFLLFASSVSNLVNSCKADSAHLMIQPFKNIAAGCLNHLTSTLTSLAVIKCRCSSNKEHLGWGCVFFYLFFSFYSTVVELAFVILKRMFNILCQNGSKWAFQLKCTSGRAVLFS